MIRLIRKSVWGMRKNSLSYLVIETRKLNKLKEEAGERDVSLVELCRRKLKPMPQLDRIERKLDKLLKK